MSLLILGLVLFLGVHSTRAVADGWRGAMIAKLGEGAWKGAYSVLSLVGFVLIVYGYGVARADPVVLWNPPIWTRHVAALLTIPAFILLAAAYVPRNRIKAAIGHPMIVGTKVWALAHLFANGNLADLFLFGGFLVWAVLAFRAARRRDRTSGIRYPSGPASLTIVTIAVGLVAWAAFAFALHGWLIGVKPFG